MTDLNAPFCWLVIPFTWYNSFHQAAVVFSDPADVTGHSRHFYKKHNVLYVAKSNVLLRTGFQRHRALSLVLDEAAFLNGAILQVFASTLLTDALAVGSVLPPQMLPNLHVCLGTKKVKQRIREFCPVGMADNGAKPRKGNAVPKGDDLISTWHVMVAVDNALRATLLKEGLEYFVSAEGGRWALPRLPRPFRPAVLSLMSDQGLFRLALHLTVSMPLRVHWCPGPCHIESNIDSGILEALNLQHMTEKTNHIAKLLRGSKRGPGKWHREIMDAFRAFETECDAVGGADLLQWFEDGYASQIALQLGLPAPVGTAGVRRILHVVRRHAHRKGIDGQSGRWMNSFDIASWAIRQRHIRLFLYSLTVVLQNCNPFTLRNIDFGDSLSDVFDKSPQSLLAACRILNDDLLFKVAGNSRYTCGSVSKSRQED